MLGIIYWWGSDRRLPADWPVYLAALQCSVWVSHTLIFAGSASAGMSRVIVKYCLPNAWQYVKITWGISDAGSVNITCGNNAEYGEQCMLLFSCYLRIGQKKYLMPQTFVVIFVIRCYVRYAVFLCIQLAQCTWMFTHLTMISILSLTCAVIGCASGGE